LYIRKAAIGAGHAHPVRRVLAKTRVEFSDLPEEVLQNREQLIRTMANHGFMVYAYEWWHFD